MTIDILTDKTPEQERAARMLTPQELTFCNLWLTCAQHGMSRGRCYLEAGLEARNVSAAAGQATRLLRKPEVVEYCRLMLGESVRATGLTLQYLDQQLKNIIDSAVTDVVSSFRVNSGRLCEETGEEIHYHTPILRCHIDDLPPEVQCAIQSIRRTKDGIDVKMYPKLDAIRLAYQRQGALTDKRELSGPDGKPLELISDEQLDAKLRDLLRDTTPTESRK